jgi:hypothetical protein
MTIPRPHRLRSVSGSITSLSAFYPDLAVLGRQYRARAHVASHVPPMTLSCLRWIGAFLMLMPLRGRI